MTKDPSTTEDGGERRHPLRLLSETDEPKPVHLTPLDLSRRWSVRESTLARWRKYGKGPPFVDLTPQAKYRTPVYRREDIEEYEAQNLCKPKNQPKHP